MRTHQRLLIQLRVLLVQHMSSVGWHAQQTKHGRVLSLKPWAQQVLQLQVNANRQKICYTVYESGFRLFGQL